MEMAAEASTDETHDGVFENVAKKDMLPLWLECMAYEPTSMGWRMGYGEDYKLKWLAFFNGLTPEKQAAYEAKFPAPKAWDDWAEGISPSRFYDYVRSSPL